jgi:signal transduction histidine kinase
MKPMPRLSGSRLLFLLLLALAGGVLFLRFLERERVHQAEQNWRETLPLRVEELGNKARGVFVERETDLLAVHNAALSTLRDSLLKKSGTASVYLKTIANQNAPGLCFELFDRDTNLIAWREDAPVQEADIRGLLGASGKTFFIHSSLIVYLAVVNEIHSGEQKLFLLSAYPIERKFELQKSESIENLGAVVEKKFKTECKIEFAPPDNTPIDGRYFKVALLNNQQDTIGAMLLKKPATRQEIQDIEEKYAALQSALLIAGYLIFAFLVLRFVAKRKQTIPEVAVFLLLLAGLRWLMFQLNVPSYYFPEELRNPEYFASKFAGGIVKSPVEFFLSTLVLFTGSVYIFQKYVGYIRTAGQSNSKKALLRFCLFLPGVALLVLLMIRGYAASVKSVIFDSSLRYYNEPTILPQIPHLLMNVSAFLLSLSAFMVMVMFIGGHLRILKPLSPKTRHIGVGAVIAVYLFVGYCFLVLQNEPLLSYPQLLFVLLLTAIAILITHNERLPFAYMVPLIGFFSSIAVVSLMTKFNSGLELESLKTTAIELRRPKPEFTQFILTDVLHEAVNNEEIISALRTDNESLSALAFLEWNKSALVDEHIPAYIGFVNKNNQVLGEFEAGIQRSQALIDDYVSSDIQDISVEPEETDDNEISGIVGVAPVRDGGRVVGYCFIEVSLMENIAAAGMNTPFQSKKRSVNGILPLENLSMAKIENGKVVYAGGDLLYSEDLLPKLMNGEYNEGNELWFRYSLGNEKYIVYAQKNNVEATTEIVSAALKEKDIEWSFFYFFKLFIIHAALLIGAYIIFAVYRISTRENLSIPFRSQLMVAFITVSVIPVIALAFYNHYNIEDKSMQAIKSSLTNQLLVVEKRLRLKVKEGETVDSAIEQCGKELGIHFSVYRGNRLVYASRWNLYQAGVLPDRLPLQADLHLNYMAGKEYFSSEETALLNSLAFYREITLKSPQPFILCVNSAFNYVAGAFSPVENDIFLFGIYSFAIFFIVAISSLLAERIARPIRRLTTATQSVAKGDLSISLDNNERGELRELINGFNTMTNELQRAQAELANFERESAWKDFARQVAHEIKNPLTPMKLTMQHLVAMYHDKSADFDAMFSKITSTILGQIETLNTIASEFSRFARMPGMQDSRVDLIEVLQEAVTLFESERISATLEAGDLKQAPARGDASQLRRTFINFIRNSIEARAKSIRFILREETKEYRLVVSDDGIGVQAGTESTIFEKSFTTKKSGMGLGLSIAKRSIENAGGSITLVQKQTPGAEFLIIYPKGGE